jgi:hypothetical protein
MSGSVEPVQTGALSSSLQLEPAEVRRCLRSYRRMHELGFDPTASNPA